jgi:hypothetical protein
VELLTTCVIVSFLSLSSLHHVLVLSSSIVLGHAIVPFALKYRVSQKNGEILEAGFFKAPRQGNC